MKENSKSYTSALAVCFCIFSILIMTSPVNAQGKIVVKGGMEVEPRPGGGKTVRETYPENDLWVYKRSIINSSNITVKETYHKRNDKDAGNNTYYNVREEHEFDCKGRITRFHQVIQDGNGQQSIEVSFYYNSEQDNIPKVFSGSKVIKLKDGTTKAFNRRKMHVENYWEDKPEYWIDCDYSNIKPIKLPDAVPCAGNESNCETAFNFFAGPGVLLVDYGSEKKALAGGQLMAKFNLTSKLGIGAGAGIYSSHIGKIKFNRALFLFNGSYSFTDPEECERTWVPAVHIISGLVIEKFGMAKGNGIIFGGGAGITRMISDKAGIKAQADMFGLKWENADEINIDYRISIGAEIHLGKKSSGIMKNPILRFKK